LRAFKAKKPVQTDKTRNRSGYTPIGCHLFGLVWGKSKKKKFKGPFNKKDFLVRIKRNYYNKGITPTINMP